MNDFAQTKMCANFIYDLNGSKGPNTVGKDIGVITAMYPTDSVVVAPMPYNKVYTGIKQQEASKQCNNMDSEARLPNLQEFASLFYNKTIFGTINTGDDFWTSTLGSDATTAKCFHMELGRVYTLERTREFSVTCVKR